MPFQNLLKFDDDMKAFEAVPEKKKKIVSKKDQDRGCDFCPLNKVKGLKKIKNLDKLQGKEIMIWAQNPGSEENKVGMELVGPAGKFLWEHAASVGLKREDCDIQNVVRCATVTENEFGQWEFHNPTKEELHCCSVYTEEALEIVQGKTKVHIVFGQVAAKTLLRGEYRKDQKTFFSEKLKAWVILTYHPSYFLRGAPRSKIKEFREALATAVAKTKGGTGKFSYIESQDYKSVLAKDLKKEIEDPILEVASKGVVISVDIEDGVNEKGENVIVYVGFSWKKGHSRGVFFNHRDLKRDSDGLRAKFYTVQRILTDKNILKALQNGVYDVWKILKLWGEKFKVRGFVHDTMLSEYLRFSGRKAFGLEATSDIRFREFAGYKDILDPYKDEKTGLVNFWTVPMKIIRIYNGADCDLTKRIQRDNKEKVNESLLKVLILVAPVLAKMELESGPLLDFEHADLLDRWLPVRIAALLKELRQMAEKAGFKGKFNPQSQPKVVEIIYDRLKLGKHLDAEWKKDFPRSTNKETMQLLEAFHPFPKRIQEFRKIAKKKSTYLDAYRRSAKLHEGRVRTKWWLTGTITCRLRSGGEKIKKKGEPTDKSKGIVNLQNIHGAEEIECLLVSDLRWRELYKEWRAKQ